MSSNKRLTRHDRLFFSLAGTGIALLTTCIFMLAHWFEGKPPGEPDPTLVLTMLVAGFLVFYRFPLLLSARHMLYMCSRAVGRWAQLVLVVLGAYVFIPGLDITTPRTVLAIWVGFTLPAVLVALVLMRLSAIRIYANPAQIRRAMFLLPGNEANTLAFRLRRSPILGMNVAGYFGDPSDSVGGEQTPSLPRLGSLDEALPAIATNAYSIVFVGMRLLLHPDAQRVLQALGNSTASIYLVPEARVFGYFRISGTDLAGMPMLALHEHHIVGLSRALKRSFDVLVGGIALILAMPVMLLVATIVRLESPGPIIFRQIRYGQDGKQITVLKFRTMYVGLDGGQVRQATFGDPRITRSGRFWRRSSLDELPQLFNVLSGDMSLVGPRPHAAQHNELYRTQISGYMLRHTVKPGITGWAQVNGLRGETDTLTKMTQRVEYDHHYIHNWSLGLDVRIILMTLRLLWSDKTAY